MIIQPHRPVAAFASQDELVHLPLGAPNGSLVAPGKLHGQGQGSALVRIHRPELRFLVRGTLHPVFFLLARSGQIAPDQHLPMDERVVIQNAG